MYIGEKAMSFEVQSIFDIGQEYLPKHWIIVTMPPLVLTSLK